MIFGLCFYDLETYFAVSVYMYTPNNLSLINIHNLNMSLVITLLFFFYFFCHAV